MVNVIRGIIHTKGREGKNLETFALYRYKPDGDKCYGRQNDQCNISPGSCNHISQPRCLSISWQEWPSAYHNNG